MATSAHTNPAYDGVDIETSKYEDTSIATDGSCDNLSFKSAPGCELSVVATTLLGVVCVALIVAIGLIVGLTAPACPLSPPAPTFPPWTDTRLPENLLPIHYDVELQPFLPPAGDFEMKGSVRIRLRVAKATSTIILSCDQIELDKSSIEVKALSADVAQPTYVDAKVDADNMYCFIIVEGELQADKEYSVFMKFQGVINDGLHGFYRTKYLGVNGSVEYFATTQFEATYARRAFPCFDEPNLKATFKVTLVRKSYHLSIWNMPITKSTTRPDDWIADETSTTVVMSTYLLAFVVGDLKYVETKTEHGTRIRAYGVPHKIEEGQADYALDVTKRTLETFEHLFEITYPMPKADLIAIPDFHWGAMENWGLVTYREAYMLFDEQLSSASDKRSITRIIAHELTHQWFGNLVTCDWWAHIWLNEGFATYFEYHGTNMIETENNYWDQFLLGDLFSILRYDSLTSAHPLVFPSLDTRVEIDNAFDSFTYSKGGSMNRMMRYYLGNETWIKALNHYLEKHQYSTATTDDLWTALKESSSVDVKAIMDSWTLQPGYPIVTVTRDYDAKTASVTQKRYLSDAKANATSYTYTVPVTYVSEAEPAKEPFHLEWMYEEELTLTENMPAAGEWLIVNPEAGGYYRVLYDSKNHDLLVAALQADPSVFAITTRANLINDAFTFASSGQMSQVEAMRSTEYLDKEDDYVPWKTALDAFRHPDTMLSTTPTYGLWLSHMVKQVNLIYSKYGWNYTPGEEPTVTHTREVATEAACWYGNQDCLDTAESLYQKWMDDPSESIPTDPNHRETAYCYGIQAGSGPEWDFAWETLQVTDYSTEKNRLYRALACTTEVWLLNRYMQRSMIDELVPADRTYLVITSVTSTHLGRYLAWDFVRANWDALSERILKDNPQRMETIFQTFAAGFNTEFDLTEFEAFRDAVAPSTPETFPENVWADAIEIIEANIKYIDENYNELFGWLTDLSTGTRKYSTIY